MLLKKRGVGGYGKCILSLYHLMVFNLRSLVCLNISYVNKYKTV